MKNNYKELIKQTYNFPQEGFDLQKGLLHFNGIDLKKILDNYGTPLRISYLPKIREQIKKARNLFNQSFKKYDYEGSYEFCYCTKCCHFSYVVKTALKERVSLETSSSYDIDLILKLYEHGALSKDTTILHNGIKTDEYIEKILLLQHQDFKHTITILDSVQELERITTQRLDEPIKIGLRISIDEKPQAAYSTSRLGINKRELLELVKEKIQPNPLLELHMIHFFVDSGINDNLYYWGEFKKALQLYIHIKQLAPSLQALNIGGGFPIRNSLGFEYDYEYIVDEIVRNIKKACVQACVSEPDIYTEFGKYTVGESGAVIFKVIGQKQQNDTELWYIIDNSLMNTIPDAWSINEKFILLPINKWEHSYKRIHIGGISCDHSDYYNSEQLNQQILLPAFDDKYGEDPLYIGFFHTGAYQEAISGYGGIKHCLIPSPRQIVVDKDEHGNLIDYLYRDEQSVSNMLSILGYDE